MAAGGVDDLDAVGGLDVEAVEVGVVVDFDGGDRFWAGLAGCGVGGLDLVARLAGGDGGGLPAQEQDRGVGGEA